MNCERCGDPTEHPFNTTDVVPHKPNLRVCMTCSMELIACITAGRCFGCMTQEGLSPLDIAGGSNAEVDHLKAGGTLKVSLVRVLVCARCKPRLRAMGAVSALPTTRPPEA